MYNYLYDKDHVTMEASRNSTPLLTSEMLLYQGTIKGKILS